MKRVASVTLLLAVGIYTFRPAPDQGRTAAVTRGTFRAGLVERGTIGAARVIAYSSSIAGAQAKILDLVPEGRAVAAGDVLVRFDPAPFEAALARESAAAEQADAELVRAREELRLERMRVDADRAAAEDQVRFAEAALASERDGKGPVSVAEAQAAADEAAGRAADTARALDDVKALLARGFATRIEVERAGQVARDAAERARVAALRAASVRNLEAPAALGRSQAELAAARTSVAAARDASNARLAERAAAVALAASRAEDAHARVATARQQVERTTIRASAAGLVVYQQLFFGTEKRKPQPGDEVWPNQPIVAIPDPAQLVVETSVRETDLHHVTGHPAISVTIDAFPGLELPGEVAFIGALAQEEPGRAGTRAFPLTVRLLRADPRLRSGMSARVDVQSRRIDDALLVPLDAIVTRGGHTACAVVSNGRAHMVNVTVAATNDVVAAVSSGLRAGDIVRRQDPDGADGERHP